MAGRTRLTIQDMRHRAGHMMAVFCCTLLPGIAWGDDTYRIGVGDTLNISIFGYDHLSRDYLVQPDGTVALHLLGRVPVDGQALQDIQETISDRAEMTFQSTPSVLVEIAAYRDIYVLGPVGKPGAYPYRPDLTVIQALALAGGLQQSQIDGSGAEEQRALDAQRRLSQSEVRLSNIDRQIAAVDTELAILEGDQGSAKMPPETAEARLIELRRLRLQRSVEREEQQFNLAETEAASMLQRRELIEGQRLAVEEQMQRTQSLLDRGLSRREQLLDLKIEADDYRADELEATAFEARARQTAANARSTIEITEVAYREELLADRIDLALERDILRAEYRASLAYLQRSSASGMTAELTETVVAVYEILRGDQIVQADLTTPLRPNDVLRLRLQFTADASH